MCARRSTHRLFTMSLKGSFAFLFLLEDERLLGLVFFFWPSMAGD